jgi:hypothetical protein
MTSRAVPKTLAGVKHSLAFCAVVMVLPGWIYARATLAGSEIILQILLNKNLPLAVFSSGMDYQATRSVPGTHFVCSAVTALIAAARLLLRFVALIMVAVTRATSLKVPSNPAIMYFRDLALAALPGMHDQAARASIKNRLHGGIRSFLPRRGSSIAKLAMYMTWSAPLRHSVVSQASGLGY